MGRKQKFTTSSTVTTPEQSKAIKKLLEHIGNREKLIIDKIKEEMMKTGFVAFLNKKISKNMIPKGTNWAWNQSNARIIYPLSDKVNVTLFKLNPRRLTDGTSSNSTNNFNDDDKPSYKLWVYQLTTSNDASNQHLSGDNQSQSSKNSKKSAKKKNNNHTNTLLSAVLNNSDVMDRMVGNGDGFITSFLWCEKGSDYTSAASPSLSSGDQSPVSSPVPSPVKNKKKQTRERAAKQKQQPKKNLHHSDDDDEDFEDEDYDESLSSPSSQKSPHPQSQNVNQQYYSSSSSSDHESYSDEYYSSDHHSPNVYSNQHFNDHSFSNNTTNTNTASNDSFQVEVMIDNNSFSRNYNNSLFDTNTAPSFEYPKSSAINNNVHFPVHGNQHHQNSNFVHNNNIPTTNNNDLNDHQMSLLAQYYHSYANSNYFYQPFDDYYQHNYPSQNINPSLVTHNYSTTIPVNNNYGARCAATKSPSFGFVSYPSDLTFDNLNLNNNNVVVNNNNNCFSSPLDDLFLDNYS